MEGWFNFLGWLLSIITAVGNAFVVVLIAKKRQLHSSANWLVVSLAVADFGVGVVVFPAGYLCFNTTVCNLRVYVAFHWFFLHSSVANLCTLTWDRYTAIVHPFKHLTCMTARRPRIVILLAWLIPLTLSSALVLGMYTTNSLTALKIIRLTTVSAFDILACVLLLYDVSRIIFVARAKAREQAREESAMQRSQQTTESIPSRRGKKHKTANFLIAIVLFFLGCHVVINSLILCITFSCGVSDIGARILTLLLVLNSAVNPLVYAFLKRDIKTELKQIIWRAKRRNNFSSSEGSTHLT